MIPTLPTLESTAYDSKSNNLRSPHIDYNSKRMSGWVSGLDALVEQLRLYLCVERYDNQLHSWQFGVEMKDLYGQPTDYIMAEIKRRIDDALLIDNRIRSTQDFEFSVKRNKVIVSFVVNTVFGEENVTIEVNT